jgi:hypothetical protein
MQTLRFPQARNVGRLYRLQDQGCFLPYTVDPKAASLEIVADALGGVPVDLGLEGRLVLAINRLGGSDLSFFDNLSGDLLYGVSFNARDTDPNQLHRLSTIPPARP